MRLSFRLAFLRQPWFAIKPAVFGNFLEIQSCRDFTSD
jgi:hypothetical protein